MKLEFEIVGFFKIKKGNRSIGEKSSDGALKLSTSSTHAEYGVSTRDTHGEGVRSHHSLLAVLLLPPPPPSQTPQPKLFIDYISTINLVIALLGNKSIITGYRLQVIDSLFLRN